MNPLKLITRPITDLTRAIVLPFKALFVVGLCALINVMTSPGHWWFQWVAFGMGIAVLLAFARAARTLAVLALVYFGGRWIYRKYGEQARAHFDEWANRTQPQANQVVQALRSVGSR